MWAGLPPPPVGAPREKQGLSRSEFGPANATSSEVATHVKLALWKAEVYESEASPIHEGELMATLVTVLDLLFGCHHEHLSRVFTLDGQTYRVCCDCGARYGYSLETMSIKRRLPRVPVPTRFQMA